MAGEAPKSNWLAQGWQWTKDHTGSPLGLAAILSGTAWLGTRALWRPAMRTMQSLGKPIAAAAGTGDDLDEYVDEQLDDGAAKNRVSAVAGLGTLALALSLMYNKRYEHGGLLSWNAPRKQNLAVFRGDPRPAKQDVPGGMKTTGSYVGMDKAASLDKLAFGMESYVDQMDWSRRVPLQAAQGLFTDDPFLPRNDRYSMNMGTAIVTDAAIRQGTSRPTLGGVFDSAADKIGSKLSLGGVVDTGVKAMVANGMARLFTGAVGAMFDLGPKARENLISAGTWAGTISSILQ